MNKKTIWLVTVFTSLALISVAIWYGANDTFADVKNQKPIGFEQHSYNLNPDPIL